MCLLVMEIPQDLLVNTEDDPCHDFPPYQTGFSGMHCDLCTPILDPSALPLMSSFIRQRWVEGGMSSYFTCYSS